jgi:hypothetical protein
LGAGGWGLGDWGWGPTPHSPIPNPQSPIPNPQFKILNFILNNKYLKSKNILNSKYYIINKD